MESTSFRGLDALPTEILRPILDDLRVSDPAALTRLLRCSKSLKNCIEPEVYASSLTRDQAMRWACLEGNTDIIRLVVEYGASASTIQLHTATDELPMLTLCLATKNRRVEAFRVLLQLGARLDVAPTSGDSARDAARRRIHMTQLRKLVNRIFSPATISAAPELTRLFFEADLDLQIKGAGQGPDIHLPLIRLIKSGVPAELVRLLLDRHADIDLNRLYADFRSEYATSALSAAVMAKSPTTFSLLVASGANIQGRDLDKPTCRALHNPVFAAAHALALATTGQAFKDATKLVQLCLDNGADINQKAPALGTPRPRRPYETNKLQQKWLRYDEHYVATPLHVFLDSLTFKEGIAAKQPAMDVQQPSQPNSVQGLDYLLSHGATTYVPGLDRELAARQPEYDGPSLAAAKRLPVTPLELLLLKWGPEALADADGEPSALFRRLVEQGGARNDHAHLLVRFTITRACSSCGQTEDFARRESAGMHLLAGLLLADVPANEASEVLRQYQRAVEQSKHAIGKASRMVIDELGGLCGEDLLRRHPST